MKKYILPLSALALMLNSCTYRDAEGVQHVSIMFWFFVAGISISFILILWLIFRKYKKRK